MQKPSLIFEHSPWFLLICILIGIVYAYILYRRKGPWGAMMNRLLFGVRAVTVAILASLLISPILKQIQNQVEKPALVFAFDNSSSIAEVVDSTQRSELKQKLEQIGAELGDKYNIEYRDLKGNTLDWFPNRVDYSEESTDLHQLLNNIRLDYEGRNLGSVILISDGIYNQGISPTFSNFNFNIFTIGIGDTVPQSDLAVNALLYNKISYQGNKFPLIAQVSHRGFANQQVQVSVIKDGRVIDSKRVRLGADNQLIDVAFQIEAVEKGYQRYQVMVEKREGEFTTLNNLQQAYVEVIEGKEQLAIIAPAPHPDIKAIKSAIESNANYSVDQYILSFPEDIQRLNATTKKYDLIIHHQLPDRRNLYSRVPNSFKTTDISALYIYGSQTDPRKFNQDNLTLQVEAVANEYDRVTAVFNQDFNSFTLSDHLQQTLSELPPINVPFGRTSFQSGTQVLLYQRVGSITTNKPLLAINNKGGSKQAVIMGEGLWLWKLTDYANNENNQAFNELITKLVQYLSSKEDKRKFKVYPIKNEFLTSEKVIFDTEVYNDLYERVYGNKIDLILTDSEGTKREFNYGTSETNTRYTISGLQEGVYKYEASTVLGNRKEYVHGEFLVKELQLENINLTADFGLLKAISRKTNGNFFTANDIENLANDLVEKKVQGTIHTTEKYLPFIHLKWLFFVLLFFLSLEWFLRKYLGAY